MFTFIIVNYIEYNDDSFIFCKSTIHMKIFQFSTR